LTTETALRGNPINEVFGGVERKAGALHMSTREIIALVRRMVRELRDGPARAAHYLRSLGWPVDRAVATLAAGRV
jgi:hypothetical protein